MKSILIVGEMLGDLEAKHNSGPFTGSSGAELLRMLGEAGVIRLTSFDREYIRKFYSENNPACISAIWDLHPEIGRTNVFMQTAPKNDVTYFAGPKTEAIPGYPPIGKSKYIREEFQYELSRLGDEILDADPNIIICLGNTPLWALAGQTSFTKIRGTTLLSTNTVLDYKLLVTYPPAAVMYQWDQRPTVIADLMKASRESLFPEIRRPPREIWIEPSLEDIREFIETHIKGCDILSCDIETAATRITCIGFAPSPSLALVVPFDDPRTKNGCYWQTKQDERACWRLVKGILEDRSVPKLFQNGAYDISFLWRAYGIKTFGGKEDTMLLSHALQPESLKGLGYLGSIYSDEGSWKHMRPKHETIKRDE